MVEHARPKHQVLQEFAAVLLRRNPMQLGQDNPLEYESEALSILSRFNEAALHLADDEESVATVATNIVRQSLEFWFDNIGTLDPEPIARELIAVYRAAMEGALTPTEAQANEEIKQILEETQDDAEAPKPVTSVTIGE